MNDLAQALAPLALQEGYNPTRLNGIGVYKASQHREREPLCYSQGIIVVVQGAKRVYLDEQIYEYNSNQYLVMTLPIPAECETLASPEKPLLALVMDIDMALLQPLVRLFDEHHQIPSESDKTSSHRCLYVSEITEALECAVLKLCQCLESPLDTAALGEGVLREILFLILSGEQAAPLFSLARHNTHLAKMERVLSYMHQHYSEPLDVEQLSSLANMSSSSFHRRFRQATGSSPVQYLKKFRLTRARELLQDKGVKVKQAATQVGYESPNQFSREFKRYFGLSPQDSSGASPIA